MSIGQSITAAGFLGTVAGLAVDHRISAAVDAFAVLYGVPVWGFAVLWIALAAALTVRPLRHGMPFALTWWSLAFPVGTFVNGHVPARRAHASARLHGRRGYRLCRPALHLGGNLWQAPQSAAPVRAGKQQVT